MTGAAPFPASLNPCPIRGFYVLMGVNGTGNADLVRNAVDTAGVVTYLYASLEIQAAAGITHWHKNTVQTTRGKR